MVLNDGKSDMTTQYVFEVRGDACETCDGASCATQPHENCQCQIVPKNEPDCTYDSTDHTYRYGPRKFDEVFGADLTRHLFGRLRDCIVGGYQFQQRPGIYRVGSSITPRNNSKPSPKNCARSARTRRGPRRLTGGSTRPEK
jgi:hypothetical protein